MDALLDKENLTPEKLVRTPSNDSHRRSLRIEDDLEDFLDEGNECYYVMSLIIRYRQSKWHRLSNSTEITRVYPINGNNSILT
jgi:hypothetical protein